MTRHYLFIPLTFIFLYSDGRRKSVPGLNTTYRLPLLLPFGSSILFNSILFSILNTCVLFYSILLLFYLYFYSILFYFLFLRAAIAASFDYLHSKPTTFTAQYTWYDDCYIAYRTCCCLFLFWYVEWLAYRTNLSNSIIDAYTIAATIAGSCCSTIAMPPFYRTVTCLFIFLPVYSVSITVLRLFLRWAASGNMSCRRRIISCLSVDERTFIRPVQYSILLK